MSYRGGRKHPCRRLRVEVSFSSVSADGASGGARVYDARGQGSYSAPLPPQTSDSSDTVGDARFVKRGKTTCASPTLFLRATAYNNML